MSRLLGLIITSMLFTLGLTTAPLVGQEVKNSDLLSTIRDANRASMEAIQTLSCRVSLKYTPVPPSKAHPNWSTAEYWYARDANRLRSIDSLTPGIDEKHDKLWKDNVLTTINEITREGQPKLLSGGRKNVATRERFLGRVDAWEAGLLALKIPNESGDVFFEEFIGMATRIGKVERTTIQNHEYCTVQLFFDKSEGSKKKATVGPVTWTVDLFFDPAVNYLVKKAVYSSTGDKGDDFKYEHQVVRFAEYETGVFFPEQVVSVLQRQGQALAHIVVDFTDVKINQALPVDIFELNFAEGMVMNDLNEQMTYKVNSKGESVSKKEPLSTQPPAPVSWMNPDGSLVTTSYWRNIVFAAILVCGLCLVLAKILRRW